MRFLLFTSLLLATAACELKFRTGQTTQREVSLDGLKLISETEDRNVAPYGSKSYVLGEKLRLLLRFESLAERAMDIDISGNKKALLYLYCSNDDCIEKGRTALTICPVTQNWMMLANWKKAHPFGAGGDWVQPGGDFDEESCIKVHEEDAPDLASHPRQLRFDMTDYVMDYAQGRRTNNGWILLTEETLGIYGEVSGSYSPRLAFDEFL